MDRRVYFSNDTIAAPATAAHAAAPVGIVRVSGPDAIRAALLICVPVEASGGRGTFFPENIESHRLYRCRFQDSIVFDDGLFVVMRAPRSFTGEDCVELHLHGNPLLLSRAMAALVGTGLVRPAERGEFSFRAFRNGKMDLSQAEAVIDLISSRSPRGAELALQSMMGATRNTLAELKRKLTAALADLEVEIDFSDQGLSRMDYGSWGEAMDCWVKEVEEIRARFLRSAPLREGVRVAIVGAPNAGKSTLFNRLLGEDRSIVSDSAGTTRDVVRETFFVEGVAFSLADTAGLRRTSEPIEAQGIERSYGEVSAAHAVLVVVDASDSEACRGAETKRMLEELRQRNAGARLLVVYNKEDLLDGSGRERLLQEVHAGEGQGILLSATQDNGLELLKNTLFRMVMPVCEEGVAPQIGRARHCELLGSAARSVGMAVERVRHGDHFPDLLAADLREAMAYLGEITGEVSADDVLNYIFAEFCIGK